MMIGFSSLARSAADRLQPDSALMILDKADKELGAENIVLSPPELAGRLIASRR